jgi:hypothetical protein
MSELLRELREVLSEYHQLALPKTIIRLIKKYEELQNKKPIVICLCGSTKFSDAFKNANLKETLAGKIVLSIGCDFKCDDALGLTGVDKIRLDELHLRKIDLADEVLILNVGGYIGESTRRELNYAIANKKHISFLEEGIDDETM